MSAEIGTADQLFEEIRELVLQDKYENMTISNLIGVLEMLKMHYWHVNVVEH
jgi:hypothetical protein